MQKKKRRDMKKKSLTRIKDRSAPIEKMMIWGMMTYHAEAQRKSTGKQALTSNSQASSLEVDLTQRQDPQWVSLEIHTIVDDAVRDHVEVLLSGIGEFSEKQPKPFNVSFLFVARQALVLAELDKDPTVCIVRRGGARTSAHREPATGQR